MAMKLDLPQNNCRNVKLAPQRKKVSEALEINRLKTLSQTDKTFKVLNINNND